MHPRGGQKSREPNQNLYAHLHLTMHYLITCHCALASYNGTQSIWHYMYTFVYKRLRSTVINNCAHRLIIPNEAPFVIPVLVPAIDFQSVLDPENQGN